MDKLIRAIAFACLVQACVAGQPFRGILRPRFEENAGQAPDNVRFLSRAPGYAAVFEEDGAIVYAAAAGSPGSGMARMRLGNANPHPIISGEGDPLAYTTVYRGGSGRKGIRAPNYSAIRYRGVYDGIDWAWHFRGSALEFQFELAPGADPGAIMIAFTGPDELRTDDNGNLVMGRDTGLYYKRPDAWQDDRGRRVPVPASFRIRSGVVTFDVGSHDPMLPLIIDPVVLYSRNLGGAGYDAAYAVATDASGGVYVTGETNSVDFFSSPAVTFTRHAFISKLSPDGTQIVYNVILASNGYDSGKAIALDRNGNVWVAGVAGGQGFPVTSDALSRSSAGVEDAFLARLNSNGQLTYCTYLGGSGSDVATSVAVDTTGNVYVAGYTLSVNFPTTTGAPQRTYAGGEDAFVVKLGGGGTTLSYATLLGGPGNDVANALSVDGTGNACVAGRTDSTNLPVVNAVQATPAGNGNGNALLACLNPAGIAWSVLTYLGGAGPTEANAIARDAAGNIYLAGDMYSTLQSSAGAYAAFAMKLNATGTAIAFTTPLGGSSSSSATGIAVDSAGDIWLAGYTQSVDFPVSGAPPFGGGFDGFITELDLDGSSLLFSRYLGGSGDDRCMGLALTSSGDPIVAGLTGSVDFPVTTGGSPPPYNAFVTRFTMELPPSVQIDQPAQGSSLAGVVTLGGWAIDNVSAVGTAIGSVEVAVDGAVVGTAAYGINRPDVCAAYPARPGCPNVGFSYDLNTSTLAPGSHLLQVIATDTNSPPDTGSAAIAVTVTSAIPPTVHIDYPTPGAVVNGTVNVGGWAIDNAMTIGTRISGVQIEVDGMPVAPASYGVSRPDVCAAFPGRIGCPNVGFSYTLNTNNLTPGAHTITVLAKDSDAVPEVGLASVTVTVTAPAPTVQIDSPAPQARASGVMNVAGWAIDNVASGGTAISSIRILVDGSFVGTATYGVARPDVCAVYPARVGCPNVGFTYPLNTATLSTGTHTLTVAATDGKGATGSATVTIVR